VDSPSLPPADLYINRELSMLEFNKRVLALAQDPEVPLLERLRFLCITCTNLDEFFEIRVAALKQRMELGALAQGPESLPAQQVFDVLRHHMLNVVSQQYELLNKVMFPQLAKSGVRFVRSEDWSEDQQQWLSDYFDDQVVPVLTPLTFDPSRPFPRVLNKSLNFIVRLKGRDAYGRRRHRGMVQAPRSLPRIIQLPEHLSSPGCHDYVFLSSVMEGQLEASRYGAAVRIEVGHECPSDLQQFLLDHFRLQEQDMYLVDGPVNLNRLATVCDIENRPELMYKPFTQGIPEELLTDTDIFTTLSKKNVLLYHPFQSFGPVVDFIKGASTDKDVLAINAGKEVTVIIELMARFDEAANISLANRLQEAGAHVVYGLVGYKTHAKMTLVVRREGDQLRRYVHLGTGNYHHSTAKVYTDYGYMSSEKKLGQDVHKIFMQLTSLTEARDLNLMLTSPFNLFDGVIAKIARETENARAGRKAHIIVKVNSLNEPRVIDALYEASQAGVKIELIVRGICTLRPGVLGLSDNITVRSILGRFLEHSRVYYFYNDGDEEIYCASADWMERNLLRRNESCFPVRQKTLKEQLKRDLELYLADNCNAWVLHGDGSYERLVPGDREPVSAQDTLLQLLASATTS
jgi:polyphosphate kinase